MSIYATEPYPDEKQVRDSILRDYLANPLLRHQFINVELCGYTVTLSGLVDSLDKKWLAEDIAADTLGVLKIRNKIDVRSEEDGASIDFYDNV